MRIARCRRSSAAAAAMMGAMALAAWSARGADATRVAAPRVEARSADLLAVGVVHEDKMSIHVSRLTDNTPVRDATVSVLLRGTRYAAVAEADGGYSLEAKDLTLPGAAVLEFQVSQAAAATESLKGTLDVAGAAAQSGSQSNARQLWWWVLNFTVCFGILWLISRRRKAAKD